MPATRPTPLINRVSDAASEVRDLVSRADVVATALTSVLDELQSRYPTEYKALQGDFLRSRIADYYTSKE